MPDFAFKRYAVPQKKRLALRRRFRTHAEYNIRCRPAAAINILNTNARGLLI
jgi:hypothetical protein